MSDMIVVMRDGVIQQQGVPDELYERPANRFVSDFIGTSNFIPATLVEADAATGRATVRNERDLAVRGRLTDPSASPIAGTKVTIAVRPERLEVVTAADADSERPGWTRVEGRIIQGTYLGDQTEYRIQTDQAGELVARRQNAAGAGGALGAGPGDPVVVRWHEDANLILVD